MKPPRTGLGRRAFRRLGPVLGLLALVAGAANPGRAGPPPGPPDGATYRTDSLRLVDTEACRAHIVTVDVVLDNPETPVLAFSFRVSYDPNYLDYSYCRRGDLVTGFTMASCGGITPSLLIGAGFSEGAPIPAGSHGTLLRISFQVRDRPLPTNPHPTVVHFESTSDDIAGFATEDGRVAIHPCRHSGDVTGDGRVTLADVEQALAFMADPTGASCFALCAADCDGSGALTTRDAQRIFRVALGQAQCANPGP